MLPELAAAGLIATRVAGDTSVRIHGLQPGHVDVRLLIDEEVNSVRALSQSASVCPTHFPCVPGRPRAGSVTRRRALHVCGRRNRPRSPGGASSRRGWS